jgi:O-methyltransferase
MMRILKDIAHSLFKSAGLEVKRLRNGHSNCATIQPWLESDALRAVMERPLNYSLVSPDRMFMLLQWLHFALAAPGEVAEFGVWRGGTALLLRDHLSSHAPDRTLHLFDSFAGLPEANPAKDNHHRKGDLADTSEAAVRDLFAGAAGVVIHPGRFEETVAEVQAERFCFAHVDADLYSSVLFASEFIFPRLNPGGVIVYDDYGFRTCAGAKAAVDEYFAEVGARPVHLTTGQCVAIKPSLPTDGQCFGNHAK